MLSGGQHGFQSTFSSSVLRLKQVGWWSYGTDREAEAHSGGLAGITQLEKRQSLFTGLIDS